MTKRIQTPFPMDWNDGPIGACASSESSVLLREYQRAIEVVKACCDREWADETPYQAAVIASNAMHWRNEEIRRLRRFIDNLRAPLTDAEYEAAGGCLFREDFEEIMAARQENKA